jgi:hypothetical protein
MPLATNVYKKLPKISKDDSLIQYGKKFMAYMLYTPFFSRAL